MKTRDEGLGPFRASEDPIPRTWTHFIDLDCRFPDQFGRFTVAAECGFWRADKTGDNLPYMLECVKELAAAPLPSRGRLRTFLSSLANGKDRSLTEVRDAMRKVTLEQDLPRRRDVRGRLIEHVSTCPETSVLSWPDYGPFADALVALMHRAASHGRDAKYLAYGAVMSDEQTLRDEATAAGKLITEKELLSLVDERATEAAMLLARAPEGLSAPPGTRLLELKLGDGGVSRENTELLKELKYSAEVMLQEWQHRCGTEKARERRDHVALITRDECQAACDNALGSGGLSGPRMLQEARERLGARCSDGSIPFPCTKEHLLGIAGILTEECRLWWGQPFDVEARRST